MLYWIAALIVKQTYISFGMFYQNISASVFVILPGADFRHFFEHLLQLHLNLSKNRVCIIHFTWDRDIPLLLCIGVWSHLKQNTSNFTLLNGFKIDSVPFVELWIRPNCWFVTPAFCVYLLSGAWLMIPVQSWVTILFCWHFLWPMILVAEELQCSHVENWTGIE